MSLDKLIETRIQDAIEAGAFKSLAGSGRPFSFDPAETLAGESWLGFKVLKNGGHLPPWLMLGREIELDYERLLRTGERYDEWVAIGAASGSWQQNAPAIRRLRESLVRWR